MKITIVERIAFIAMAGIALQYNINSIALMLSIAALIPNEITKGDV